MRILFALLIVLCFRLIGGTQYYSTSNGFLRSKLNGLPPLQDHAESELVPRTRKRANLYGEKEQVSTDQMDDVKDIVDEALASFSESVQHSIELVKINSAVRQTVAGMFYVVDAELLTNGVKINCILKIWDRPYLKDGNHSSMKCGTLRPMTHTYTTKRFNNSSEGLETNLDPIHHTEIQNNDNPMNSIKKRPTPDTDPFSVYIRTPDNQTIFIRVETNETVAEIKKKLLEANVIVETKTPLYFNGQILDDTRTLLSYNVRDDSILHFGSVHLN